MLHLIVLEALKKLHHTIQKKRHDILSRNIKMLYDNAWPHTAAKNPRAYHIIWLGINRSSLLPSVLYSASPGVHLFVYFK